MYWKVFDMDYHEGPMDREYKDRVVEAIIAASPILAEACYCEELECELSELSFYEPYNPAWPIGEQLDEIIVGWARQIGKQLVEADRKAGDSFDGYIVQLFQSAGFGRVVYLSNGEWEVHPIALQSMEFNIGLIWMEAELTPCPRLRLRTRLAIAS